jgi:DNA polymerase III gamma/tau subunit
MVLAATDGQQQIIEQLQQQVRLQRISHAYIFAGPRGVGKSEVALKFAMVLKC